ncbi:MAG: tripartite tricarboxylate transporter substrate binding protein [Burkholderiales bacterium]|nr:tripartite tricarboxylate transporter substrate binding protein [Burkholderiales bacterium]
MSLENKGRRRALASLALRAIMAAMLCPFASAAWSQDYPTKPVRIIVPWPAGGITDSAGRMLASQLQTRLSNPVVVENKPGATAMIGATFVAKAPADGYTLLVASSETHGINPHTFSKLSYDPAKDFVAIAAFAINPFSVVARGDFPAASLREMVQVVQANPGRYSYSSAGLGSASQLGMEIVKLRLGLNLLHVPFQGEAPAVTALMGGQTDLQMLPAGRAATLRMGGKVKVYAVTTPERYFGMTDVPTLSESGFDKLAIANWFGVVAPAKTPTAIVQRLYAEVQAVMKSDEARAALRGLGLDVHPSVTLQEFQQFVAAEPARWGEVIAQANIKLEKR